MKLKVFQITINHNAKTKKKIKKKSSLNNVFFTDAINYNDIMHLEKKY